MIASRDLPSDGDENYNGIESGAKHTKSSEVARIQMTDTQLSLDSPNPPCKVHLNQRSNRQSLD
jgi:hypothetical protein